MYGKDQLKINFKLLNLSILKSMTSEEYSCSLQYFIWHV